jgi:two-component system response regulator FixJ
MTRTRTPAGSHPEGIVVYVIDDDRSMSRSLSRLLKISAWKVRSFSNAEDFLSELDNLCSGLLIVDVQLPGMSGLELLERLQERHLSWPAIAMSGSDDENVEPRALRLGAKTFLRKPFAPQVLLDALEQMARSSNGKALRSSG